MFKIKLFWWISCTYNPLKSSKKAFECGNWFFCESCAVAGYVSVTVLLLLLWVAVRSCDMVICESGYWYRAFLGGGSVWIVSFDNIVIMLATFVVCRVIPATRGTFHWCVPSLIAIFAVMWATTFDTRVGFVAVRSCVSILLTSYALWDMFLVRSRRFYVDNLILDGHYIVYVFIIGCWF